MTALDLRAQRGLRLSPRHRKQPPSAPPFMPAQIVGLACWYDAVESPRIELSGKLQRWGDLSGNANHAEQDDASARPVPVTDAADRPAIRFDGVDDVLLVAQPFDLGPGVTGFVVFRMRERTDFTGILAAAAATGADHEAFFALRNGTAASLAIQLSGKSLQPDPLALDSVDTTDIQYAIFTIGAAGGTLRDLGGESSDTTTSSALGLPAALALGAGLNGGLAAAFGAVDLYEVGLYPRVLDPAELDQLEGYVRARRGLSWSPLQFGTDLAWLHDVDESSFVESDGAVDRWHDRTSNGRHFEQNGASRPARANDAAGRQIVRFDGIDDVMVMAGTLPSLDPFTLALVYTVRERGDFVGLVSAAPASGADVNEFWSLQTTTADGADIQLVGREVETDQLVLVRPDTASAEIALWTTNAGSGSLADRTGEATDTYAGSFGVPAEIVLGGRYDGAPFGQAAVDVFATVGIGRALTIQEQADLIAWAERRWGL